MDTHQNLESAESFFAHLVEREGIGTAIVAAAGVAGAQLIRGTGIDFSNLEPGSYVLIDFLNEPGIELLSHLDQALDRLAGTPIGKWALPPLEGTGPDKSITELVAVYEAPFRAGCERAGVPASEWPRVAIETAALLIHRGSPVLDRDLGKSIVAQALVASVKSVPPPLSQ